MSMAKVRMLSLPFWCLVAPAILPCGAMLACGTESAESVEENQEPIIGGTVPTRGTLESFGVVSLGGCTGTMLTNRHILTAHHCTGRYNFTAEDWSGTLNAPGTMTVRLERALVDSTASNLSILEPPGDAGTWTLDDGDYSLITLDQALEANGSSDSFYNAIYASSDASLLNQTVLCMGYGGTTEATQMTFASGFNTLTSANMTINSASGGVLRRDRTSGGIVGFGGDSGSTCYFNGLVTGVQSTCKASFVDVNGNGVNDGWAERNNTQWCKSAAPGQFRDWAENAILADVTVTFDAMPPMAAEATLQGTVTTTSGVNSVNLLAGMTLTKKAPRSGRVGVAVDVEPDGMLCPVVDATSPMSGSLSISARCLGDGLVAALL